MYTMPPMKKSKADDSRTHRQTTLTSKLKAIDIPHSPAGASTTEPSVYIVLLLKDKT